MRGPQATLLPCGRRLHLQYGPIDLIIGADGNRALAFEAARARFHGMLEDLVAELELLRQPVSVRPQGRVARRMHRATQPLAEHVITPMAAVAGSVADEVLQAMIHAAPLPRAYVNNGGDIALHLQSGQTFKTAISLHSGQQIGRINVDHRVGGIATSGRHGRSLSLGIADAVTVLARSAAEADAAATLLANAVDLPDHRAVTRQPAHDLDPDSDLGARLVVTGCAPLCATDREKALMRGLKLAQDMQNHYLIIAACLHLQGETKTLGPGIVHSAKALAHA